MPWPKGKPRSEEERKKIGTGVRTNPQHKESCRVAGDRKRGIPRTEETRNRIRTGVLDFLGGYGDDRAAWRYRDWREKIVKRDNYTCQNCGKINLTGKDCHAHHIKSWELYPELRYVLQNGKTLCLKCHMKEESIANKKNALDLKNIKEALIELDNSRALYPEIDDFLLKIRAILK